MDKTVLVGPDVEAGREFLDLLSRQDIRVNAALWQYQELLGRWRLTLVSPLVDELGPKETYRRIDHALENSDPRPRIDILDVSVMSVKAPFYKSLRRELRNVQNRHLTMQPVGDHFVKDGFVYFVK